MWGRTAPGSLTVRTWREVARSWERTRESGGRGSSRLVGSGHWVPGSGGFALLGQVWGACGSLTDKGQSEAGERVHYEAGTVGGKHRIREDLLSAEALRKGSERGVCVRACGCVLQLCHLIEWILGVHRLRTQVLERVRGSSGRGRVSQEVFLKGVKPRRLVNLRVGNPGVSGCRCVLIQVLKCSFGLCFLSLPSMLIPLSCGGFVLR